MNRVTVYHKTNSEAQRTAETQATPMESTVGVNLRRQMRLWVGAVLHGTVSPEAFGKWFARLTDAEVTLVAGESVLRA